ncbi:MAG: prolyl oligopeptidase family serine peptidase [Candidatus Velthaea sp.]
MASADNYHGTVVPDPYRWLEDLDSAETSAWVTAQDDLTESFLATVPERDGIRERLTALWDYERYSVPMREGANYVYSKNTGLQNQAVLYVAPALGAPARTLLDPNALSADGTVALSGASFSDDGTLLAYAMSASGSDWLEWRVREVATGKDRDDLVRWSKFSGAAWRKDGSGFYYSRYDEPLPGAAQFKDANYFHKVYFHQLGTDQTEDALVFERPDHKDWNFSTAVTDDGRWLIVDMSEGTDPKNGIAVVDLRLAGAKPTQLIAQGEALYSFIGNDDDVFYFRTTLDAPRGRVVAVELAGDSPREIIAQTQDTLEDVALFGDRFIAQYLHDAHSLVDIYDLEGTLLREIPLPGLGSAGGFTGKRDDRETFFSFTSYTMPTTIYRYDLAAATVSAVFTPRVAFDPAEYTSEQVFYISKDGTRVPMIVSSKRGIARDGATPTILYGYGGFNISLTPAFSPAMLVWMEMGGRYAVANLRGGGEYGEAWHEAGTKANKQNVFDDFIAAAEYLIEHKYTSTPKLAISGGSNGGLLVGAAMTQRPDLFGAALPAVGVMDMLRFQKFTIGWAWVSDYGSSDDPADFANLYAYSPLHNLRMNGGYPPTMITTADHDDRVYPAHSFKFAAQLQHVQSGDDAPALIRIETKAGHGAGKPTSKMIDEAADRYAFLTRVLGM